jgi:hypothetical protein
MRVARDLIRVEELMPVGGAVQHMRLDEPWPPALVAHLHDSPRRDRGDYLIAIDRHSSLNSRSIDTSPRASLSSL